MIRLIRMFPSLPTNCLTHCDSYLFRQLDADGFVTMGPGSREKRANALAWSVSSHFEADLIVF